MGKELMFETIKYLPHIVTYNHRITEASYAFTNLTGYEQNELLGISVLDIQKKLKFNISLDNMQSEVSCFIFTKDCKARDVTLMIQEGLTRSQKIYVFFEKPNSRLEDKFPVIYRLMHDDVFITAIFSIPDLLILKANKAYCNYLREYRNDIENFIGMRISDIITDWQDSTIESALHGLANADGTIHINEYARSTPLSNMYWNSSFIPIYEGVNLKYCVEISVNTSKSSINQNLNSQYENLYNVIENLDLPIIRLAFPQLSIIEINKKAYEFICLKDGCNEQESPRIEPGANIKDYFSDLVCGDNSKYIYETEQTKKAVHADGVKIVRNGCASYFNLIYQPLTDFNNEVAELIIIAVDITREVKQKEALDKTLQLQKDFFSFISHEFKTPLTVINAAIQAIESLCKDELGEKTRGFINKIHQNTLRQLRLVNNLLDIARADSGFMKVHLRKVDISSMTRIIIESVSLYAKDKNITINLNNNVKQSYIAIDDEKYERIILNLLSNAIKFTENGKFINVSLYSDYKNVYIEVEDEGIGIPKDKQSIIFDRFSQVNSSLTRMSEGTGIGLSLVKLLVISLGGKLSLVSEVGKGSKFTVELPLPEADCIMEDEHDFQASDNRLLQAAAIEFSDIYLS